MSLQKNKLIYKVYSYILLFFIAFIIILSGTFFFYSNLKKRQNSIESNSDYINLDLYFLKTTKTAGIKINNYGLVGEDLQSYFITFENTDGSKNTFMKIDNIIYFNKIKLCENVDVFKVIVDKTGKESISLEATIQGKVYTSQYVIE